jgi:hypothetical protein
MPQRSEKWLETGVDQQSKVSLLDTFPPFP